MQVTDPRRKRPMRGRTCSGKRDEGGDALGRDQRAVERRGQQGGEGKSRRGTGDGRGRGTKTVVEHQHSRKFEFTLVGRWDVKREVGSGDHRNRRKNPLATKPPDFNFCL